MKAVFKLTTIALFIASTGAFAQQSKSDVSVDNVIVTNAAVLGSKADQTIEVGNATGGGQASVKGKNAVTRKVAANRTSLPKTSS